MLAAVIPNQEHNLPGKRGSPVIPIGAIPKLFIAVVQAVGSDMPKSIGGDSRFRFGMLSAERIMIDKHINKCTLKKNYHYYLPRFFIFFTNDKTGRESGRIQINLHCKMTPCISWQMMG